MDFGSFHHRKSDAQNETDRKWRFKVNAQLIYADAVSFFVFSFASLKQREGDWNYKGQSTRDEILISVSDMYLLVCFSPLLEKNKVLLFLFFLLFS